jgi:hypothetical protein
MEPEKGFEPLTCALRGQVRGTFWVARCRSVSHSCWSRGVPSTSRQGHCNAPRHAATRLLGQDHGCRPPSPGRQRERHDGSTSTGEELLEERRRRRRAGNPRLSEADRECLGRLTDGDLADEFQAQLDAISRRRPAVGRRAGRRHRRLSGRKVFTTRYQV